MHRLLTFALALLLMPALQGCMATSNGLLTNRVMLSVSHDSCATNSRWGVLAIGSDIAEQDCKTIIDGVRLRLAMEALAAAQAAQDGQARGK
jgi:hypothetical protein